MKRKLSLIVLSLMLALVLGACSTTPSATPAPTQAPTAAPSAEATPEPTEAPQETPAAPAQITVKHDLGETTLTTNPQRVVVFDFGTLDVLDFAGIDVVGIGKGGAMPESLAKYSEAPYEVVGSLHEPDFEKVNELQPDLILIGARASTAYDELTKIAPTVLMSLPGATYMDTFKANVNILTQIFPDKAELLNTQFASIETAIEGVAATVKEKGYTALVIMANDGEFSVFGEGSRFGMVYENLGFTATDSDVDASTHGQSATFEYLAQQDPDYLFVIDRSAATGTATDNSGAQQLLDNDLVKGMKASQNDNIVYLHSGNWYVVSGGINSTTSMIQEVADAVQK